MPKRASSLGQLHLPFRIPAKEWFGPREAGAVLGLSERTIEELYERGDLSGHRHNAGAGKRMTKRIPRAWVVAYAIQTADYDDESLAEALLATLPHLPATTLLRLAERARHLAADKPIAP